jgi:hypothetical protein
MRFVPDDRLAAIEAALLHAGFAVTVTERKRDLSVGAPENIVASLPDRWKIVHTIAVTDGHNTITLTYDPVAGAFSEYGIWIPNLGAWWPRRNRELRAFQSRVTGVLESVGAYRRYPDAAG